VASKISHNILIFLLLLLSNTSFSTAFWEKSSPNNNFLTTVETTPWGILIGEFDTRIWLNPPPLNDIYISKDLGRTWIPLGLSKRGIKDIKFFQGKIYAATYYVIDNKNGLFVSEDLGKTWKQIGPMFSPTKVNRDSKTIYLGGESHGLWISQDEGITWNQKLGTGQFGPNIKAIESSGDITYVTTLDKVYKTLDNGSSWEEVTFLNNKGIEHFCINGNLIFAGSSGTSGLYKSTDLGLTWEKVQSFGNYAVGDLVFYNNSLYVGRVNPLLTNIYTVYKSSNLGFSWEDTQLNVPSLKWVADMAWVFSNPSYLYAISINNGIYKYIIPKQIPEKFQFLDIPWKNGTIKDLIDKITSFFDHEYPLLGYAYYEEPKETNKTTLNFYGDRDLEPNLYYSSHNGTDYALSYGSEIVSPANGIASYYSCTDCGNSIRITHPNGYQTIFMHLQKAGLITLGNNVPISSGIVIGKVGMTGNTNGPHLHFEVLKNGLYPDGLVDPYGWLNSEIPDPWPFFTWQDPLGQHRGTESLYLWNGEPSNLSKLVVGSGSLTLDNKVISWNNSSSPSQTIFLKNYFQPIIPKIQENLIYLSNSSILLDAYDFLGEKIASFSEPIEIRINFSEEDITNIIKESIKIYFWNNLNSLWESIPTILDLISNTAAGQTYHFSNFVLLGEKLDSSVPVTQIIISGSKEGEWFVEYPTVELSAVESGSSQAIIFYTFEGEAGWEEYAEPFIINKDGITHIQFRSMDQNGNIEDTQTYTIQINTKGKGTKTVKVINATFSIL
jgi:murein DD-endopeptidase MepM/ murein hydrolase activator NlpD